MAYTVKQARMLKGFSRKYMADALGISERSYFSKEMKPGTFKAWEIEKFLQTVGMGYYDIIFVNEPITNVKE